MTFKNKCRLNIKKMVCIVFRVRTCVWRFIMWRNELSFPPEDRRAPYQKKKNRKSKLANDVLEIINVSGQCIDSNAGDKFEKIKNEEADMQAFYNQIN